MKKRRKRKKKMREGEKVERGKKRLGNGKKRIETVQIKKKKKAFQNMI